MEKVRGNEISIYDLIFLKKIYYHLLILGFHLLLRV